MANLNSAYEKWKSSLREKDRSIENVTANFDELFDAFSYAGATFEEAHPYLQQAIKAHLPSASLGKAIWKMVKNNPANVDMNEKDFFDGWCKDIADRATNSFYNAFPIPNDQDEKEPKIYGDGKISEKEYKLLRDHANKFKPLDLNALPDPNEDLMTEDELLEFIKGQIK